MTWSRRMFLVAGGALAGALAGGLLRGRPSRRPGGALRPPGAENEATFLARCIRCQQCIQACPPRVLRPDNGWGADTAAPCFVPREVPCDLCFGRDDMKCISVCPTGALTALPRRADVRIGLAVVNTETCFPYVGVACRACWHACPFPDAAISVDEGGHPQVHPDACVGCGLCEHACLSNPASICVVAWANDAAGLPIGE